MTKEIKDVYRLILVSGLHDLKVRGGRFWFNYKTCPYLGGMRRIKDYGGQPGWWDILYNYAKDKT